MGRMFSVHCSGVIGIGRKLSTFCTQTMYLMLLCIYRNYGKELRAKKTSTVRIDPTFGMEKIN